MEGLWDQNVDNMFVMGKEGKLMLHMTVLFLVCLLFVRSCFRSLGFRFEDLSRIEIMSDFFVG
ncbi:hypothetical protein [Candidatus Hodgkinia cicadicola]|uniref:hypothetical protein n=1 Tax=Candidatus Hodgkinia cicadicola TaxID=573658 RepID=UPI001788DD6A